MDLLNFNPLLWTQKIIAFAVLLQGIELLCLQKVYRDDGIWRWQTLEREFLIFPKLIQKLLSLFLKHPNFLFLLFAQCFAALLLLLGNQSFNWAFVLLLSSLFVSIRWRGTFNGGSDYMTIVVLSALTVAGAFQDNVFVLLGCLWYIALQSCLSYFLAGICKIKNRNWHMGFALRCFLNSASYDLPRSLSGLLKNNGTLLLLSWFIILFECSFPIVFLNPNFALSYIAIAIPFHLGNFYILGLNRFIFVWAATYPALYFCSTIVHS